MMTLRRGLLCSVVLILAVLVEVTILAPLPFPGATPTLVLVVVVALSAQFGASTGAVCGFTGGLLVDIAPPAAGSIGVTALLLTVVGYVVGRFAESDERPWPFFVVLAAVAAAFTTLGGALIGGLLGDPRVRWDEVLGLMLTSSLYAAILALVLLLPIAWLSRRIVPEAYTR